MDNPASAAPRASARFRFGGIWIGRDGLRAGWAILLFLVLCIAVIFAIGHVAYVLHHPFQLHGDLTPGNSLLLEAAMCCAALIATLAMSRLERKSWLDSGLRSARRAADFGQGAFWGVAAISALMGMLALTHGARIEFSGASAQSLLESGLVWAIVFMLVGITEELTFRGYPFFRLARGTNPLIAATLLSLLFGAVHLTNHGESLIGVTQVFLFGLVASLAVWRTGSVWWVIGLHAAWDWSETFLFGTADSGLGAQGHLLSTHPGGPVWLSGGSVGPEASVLMLPVLGLLAWIVVKTLPQVERAAATRTLRVA
ncbi:CPBP family intramembrane glutamic endopeptidase [Paraburkholderia phenazinium]|jgi:membrane protease YdiL (CAAX protease family)|uniref:CAAX prenyl protease 2/Lysostaphin resistance protein A-like domain-containing protein n=1 Tax=Paraburkholderia phenazinium TaxID=60549 RepID=A0A1G7SN88_9BURK|nr:type II CAAX endopeptidase family protein [Paraburkholderia phenazinium]SDG24536.1 hypothetical protein SAMN05216466_102592 [Paraburkholderia phenazinium]